jgi:signal transduction histidine kinase
LNKKIREFVSRLSLSQQFLMLSFPVLLAGTLIIGRWIGSRVQDSVMHRIGAVTALYVDSLVAPHIQSLVRNKELNEADRDAIANDLISTPLGKKIVSLKIWRRDGLVLYSNDPAVTGRKFQVDDGLMAAFRGDIFSEISERSTEQQGLHGQPLPRMIETYTPLHAERTGSVLAVAEFYQKPDEVDRDVAAAKQQSWLLVGGTTLMMYLLLFALVRKGNQTIENQQNDLNVKVAQLTALNQKNTELQGRVIHAAEKATVLNEIFLRRVSADIHDGPGQDLGFALMQLKNMADGGQPQDGPPPPPQLNNLAQARIAVESALHDLRAISTNLDLPDIEGFNLAAIASRVVRDFQIKTGMTVKLDILMGHDSASFRVKVTLYRLLQESLANTLRHAQCRDCSVILRGNSSYLTVEVRDAGPGFDPVEAAKRGRLGLQGMRQRIEVLGGEFELTSVIGQGTQIRARLPLIFDGVQDD